MDNDSTRTSRFIKSLANAELPDKRMTILYPIALAVIGIMVFVALFLGGGGTPSTQPNSNSNSGGTNQTTQTTQTPNSTTPTTLFDGNTTNVPDSTGVGVDTVPTASVSAAQNSIKSSIPGTMTTTIVSNSGNTIAFKITGVDQTGSVVTVTVVVVNKNGVWQVATGG